MSNERIRLTAAAATIAAPRYYWYAISARVDYVVARRPASALSASEREPSSGASASAQPGTRSGPIAAHAATISPHISTFPLSAQFSSFFLNARRLSASSSHRKCIFYSISFEAQRQNENRRSSAETHELQYTLIYLYLLMRYIHL